jgi:ATP-binding cassette subfamily B protein
MDTEQEPDRRTFRAAGGRASRSGTAPQIESLEFDRIWFAYPEGDPVLKDVSFRLDRGQTIAVVGPTGSGKTTLINLIMRFYDPASGVIRLNGEDIKSIHTDALRQSMALVMQDPFLFSESIRDNILRGNERLTEAKLEKILHASRCTGLIERLPEGIDTVLGESGGSISSGERQLLSIARAFAKDPQLLILDEATSYIDTQTEQEIQTALAALMQQRTALVVAHRLSTARQADQIMVINRGRIVESGTHAKLMEKAGFYFRLNQVEG